MQSSLWCYNTSTQSRVDVGVVVYNEQGGCSLCSIMHNTIHYRLGSSTFLRGSYRKGIILRVTTLMNYLADDGSAELMHLLDDAFAYAVTRWAII